jgi:hypothetical protein
MSVDLAGFLPAANLRDHIVPQGFLRGFLAPGKHRISGTLAVFKKKERRWRWRTTDQICWASGFYDYSDPAAADASADDAFRPFEQKISEVREKIQRDGHETWERHREFLVAFFQMLRVRNLLFRAQVIAEQRRVGMFLEVKEWIAATKYRSREHAWSDIENADELLKNKSITDMRGELSKGGGDWLSFSWTLGTTDFTTPFVTSDVPVVMSGSPADPYAALTRSEFALVVPFAWDMCLIGTPRQMSARTRRLTKREVRLANEGPLSAAERLVVSPVRLPSIRRELDRLRPAVPIIDPKGPPRTV